MVKVTLLKQHLQYRQGEEVYIDEGIATYWERVGVATTDNAALLPDEVVKDKLTKTLKKAKKKK